MGKENTCCFTGHRDIPAEQLSAVSERIHTAILQAIADGYTHFICGFAIGSDLIFAETITALKRTYSLTLEAAIPYPERMNTSDESFRRLISGCDIIHIHSDHYFGGCYMRRNRYMVSQSGRVIAVYDGRQTGGTASTLELAKAVHCRAVIISLPLCR